MKTKPDKHDWLPIETAPQNTEVELAIPNPEGGPHMVERGVCFPVHGWKAAFLVRGPDTWRRGDVTPTHWKPISEPPEAP